MQLDVPVICLHKRVPISGIVDLFAGGKIRVKSSAAACQAVYQFQFYLRL